MKFGKRIKVDVSLLIAPLIVIIIIYDYFIRYLMTFIFISAHEFGHIGMALLQGAKLYGLRILPIGLNALIDDTQCSNNSRILIYVAGPFINLVMAAFCFVLGAPSWTAVINIALAVFNLLPVQTLDGGKIAREILTIRMGLFQAGKYLKIISAIICTMIIGIGFFVFYRTSYNVSFILIGTYLFLCMKGSKGEITFMNIRNLLYRRARILKKGIYPVREIVVMKNMLLSDVIKAMDYADTFHIVNILDENLRVIKVMTEQEILNASIENGTDLTFDKLLTINDK